MISRAIREDWTRKSRFVVAPQNWSLTNSSVNVKPSEKDLLGRLNARDIVNYVITRAPFYGISSYDEYVLEPHLHIPFPK